MAVVDEIKVIMNADSAQAVRAMRKAQKETDSVEQKTKRMIATLAKSALAWGGAAMSIRSVVRNIKQSVQAYGEQEKAEASLNAAIMATGRESEISAEAIHKLAAELQEVTTFGDEATISAAAMAQQLGNMSQRELTAIIPQIQNFAAAMGMDLNSAARLVGQTIGGTTNTLSRYGVQIDNSLKGSERFDAVLGQLSGKFDGFAVAMGQTALGSLEQFNNALGDLREQGGETIMGFFEPAVRAATSFVEELTAAAQASRDLKDVMAGPEEVSSLQQINNAMRAQQAVIDEVVFNLSRTGRETSSRLESEQEILKQLERQRDQLAIQQRYSDQARRASEERASIEQARARAQEEAEAAMLSHQDRLRQAYARTNDGQVAALQESIRYFSTFRNEAGEHGPMASAILEELRGRLAALTSEATDGTEAVKKFGNSWRDAFADEQMQIMNEDWIASGPMAEMEEAPEIIADKWGQAFQQIGASAIQTFAMLNQLSQQRTQREIAEIQKQVDAMSNRHELELAWAEAAGATEEQLAEMKAEQMEAKQEAEEAADKEKKKLIQKQFKRDQAMQIGQTSMATATAMMQALAQLGPIAGFAAAAAVGAMGAAQIGMITQQKVPAYARGGEFVTNGPQLMMVGDNPGGRERVRIDPQPDNRSGGGGGGITVNVQAVAGSDREVIAEWVAEGIRRGQQRGTIGAVA